MKYHLSVSIHGLEIRLFGKEKSGTWQILAHENGTFLTKSEVFVEINRCKRLGYEVIPGCDNHDEKGNCKGHPDDV